MTTVLDVGDPTPLGRIRLHDSRSREHQFFSTPEPGLSIVHRMDASHLDQFYLSGCVGFFGGQILNCRIARKSRQKARLVTTRLGTNYLQNADAIDFYSHATQFDPFDWEYPPTDNGSSAIGLLEYWKMFHIIKEYQWTFDFQSFLAAVQLQPVGLGTNWYENMTTPDAQGIAHPTGRSQGGHQYLCNGLLWGRYTLPSKRKAHCEQSWGENIEFPTFYILLEELEHLIINEGGDVAVPRFL